ncbi:MAG: hypothetical protein HQ481_19855 [Alphaproteobacteria bacterium]|nr:hypothetical protein [Alphaproteobacteria bacterium]
MDVALILDALLVVLLLATIVYAIVLNRRLGSLRANRGELETFVARMNEATSRAEASLKGIRQAAEQAQRSIDAPAQKAQALRDELLFLIERADTVAERMAVSQSAGTVGAGKAQAGGIGAAAPRRAPKSRDRTTPAAEVPRDDPPLDEDGEAVRSKAERDLMNALRNVR